MANVVYTDAVIDGITSDMISTYCVSAEAIGDHVVLGDSCFDEMKTLVGLLNARGYRVFSRIGA